MPRPQHYSPTIKRHLVTALYHEAQKQGRPMTAVTNDILEEALRDTDAWHHIESGGAMILNDAPPSSQQK
jgi:hypothetical protein